MKGGQISTDQLERIQRTLARVPFAKLVGIEFESAETGAATLVMPVREKLKQNHGVVHGGAIASVIDTATAIAIITILGPDERVSTVDLTINYLRALRSGEARATARVLKAGRRLIVVSADVVDDTGNLVATALSTYIKI